MNEETVSGMPGGPLTTPDQGGSRPNGFGNWLGGWICLLGTVFLAGATINSLMRWLPYHNPWDLGGFALSGFLAWFCYQRTLSRNAIPNQGNRIALAVILPFAWTVFFPAVMWALGFK